MSIICITADTLHAAAPYVEECAKTAEVHTVKLITNGAHGGVDVIIEGTTPKGDGPSDADYERTYQVNAGQF